ncbi:UNVERIFIED_CONTAM: hypothetical protein GTU68_031287 [Idotea baltica]|nr:hypothetical protein [Idotea baltica]
MIQIDNVTKTYQQGLKQTEVLRGISCEIPDGEFAFIVGPSGSGKSTLLYLMGALDVPTAGSIELDGQDVAKLSPIAADELRRRQLGFVFQSFNLIRNLTAVDNVLVPFLPDGRQPEMKAKASELLSSIGLGDRLHHLPSQLSGGEQQRVAIARAILKQPKYVFADEPTGELDSATGQVVFEMLRKLHEEQGTTIVTVTHDDRYIRDSDRILRIEDGRIIEP